MNVTTINKFTFEGTGRVWCEERTKLLENMAIKQEIKYLEKFMLIPSADENYKKDIFKRIVFLKEKLIKLEN